MSVEALLEIVYIAAFVLSISILFKKIHEIHYKNHEMQAENENKHK